MMDQKLYVSQDQIFKLTTSKRLTEPPTRRRHIVAGHDSPITGCYFKREALTAKIRVTLPVLTPVPCHRLPSGFRPFDRDPMDIPRTANVGYQNQHEVRVTVNREPHSSSFNAWQPGQFQRDNARSLRKPVVIGQSGGVAGCTIRHCHWPTRSSAGSSWWQ